MGSSGSGVAVAIARVAAVAAAGFALTWAFSVSGWLAVPSVTVLTLALWRRGAGEGALLGLVYGLAFYLPLIDWMRVVGDDAWVMLSLLCTVWMALLGALVALVTRLPLWPLWAGCVWVLDEALRTRVPWGGFAWGRLAFSQADTPLAFLASAGGAPLVTFVVGLLGALLAAAALHLVPALGARPRWGPPAQRSSGLAATSLVAAAAVVLAALAVSAVPVLPQPGTESTVRVAVVQGSVPAAGLGFQGEPRDVLTNHVRATRELAREVERGQRPRPEVVIWPENASDLDPFTDRSVAADIQSAVDAIGVPTLVGAVITNPADADTVLNVGIVWTPDAGPGRLYAKRHPVPFGEYIPFRPVLERIIDRFALVPRDFAAGDEPGVLALGPTVVGDVICFEVADDLVVREAVTGGGRLLVVQTNNATYGYTSQPAQQLAITRLRAIEHGRATLVASTSGVSAIISPRGEVTQSLPEFESGTLDAEVLQTTALTLADRLGEWPERALALVGLVAALWAILARRLGSDRAEGRSGREERVVRA